MAGNATRHFSSILLITLLTIRSHLNIFEPGTTLEGTHQFLVVVIYSYKRYGSSFIVACKEEFIFLAYQYYVLIVCKMILVVKLFNLVHRQWAEQVYLHIAYRVHAGSHSFYLLLAMFTVRHK